METKYWRLIKFRLRTLHTLTSAYTDKQNNFTTLFDMLNKFCRCNSAVRSRFDKEVYFAGEFSTLETRIGLLL